MSVASDEIKLASKATGAKLSIFVHLNEDPKPAFVHIEDNFPVAELMTRIKAVWAPALEKYVARDLVVHTKDADNKLHLLDNAELELADALKCDSKGKYRVYVEEIAAGYAMLPGSLIPGLVQVERPPTDGMVPSRRIQFWQSLFAATLMQDKGDPFHYLPLCSHYGPSNALEDLKIEGKLSHQLIVRNCYEPLFTRMAHELFKGMKVFVTGTPGVGKSTFRNYVAWSLLQHFQKEKQPLAIAMVKGDVSDIDVMCWDGATFCIEYWNNVAALLRKFENGPYKLGRNAFFLADVSRGMVGVIEQIPTGLAVFTSPNESAWHEPSKQSTAIFLMPLWKKEELLARQSSVPGVDFGERFIKYGGLVRAVWGDDTTLRELNDKLCTPLEPTTIEALKVSDYPKVQHKFVYLIVAENKKGEYNFDQDLKSPNPNPSLEIGTRYIARLIAKSWVQKLVDKTNYQFFAAAPPSVAGLMFEAVALELLLNYSQTTHFSISSLYLDPPAALAKLFTGDWRNRTGKFHPKPPTLVEFNNESDVVTAVDTALAADGAVVLALPRSTTFAGFDGIYAWKEGTEKIALLLQVTRTSNHPLGNGGGKVLAAFAAFQLCIGYFVDPTIFEGFSNQVLKDNFKDKHNKKLFLKTPQICLKAVAPSSFEGASLPDASDTSLEAAAKKLKH